MLESIRLGTLEDGPEETIVKNTTQAVNEAIGRLVVDIRLMGDRVPMEAMNELVVHMISLDLITERMKEWGEKIPSALRDGVMKLRMDLTRAISKINRSFTPEGRTLMQSVVHIKNQLAPVWGPEALLDYAEFGTCREVLARSSNAAASLPLPAESPNGAKVASV